MASSGGHSSSQRKLALIIANENYHRSENRLTRSIETSKTVGDVLKRMGFKVTVVRNLGKHDMLTSVIDFADTISSGDLVLFDFVGQACQVKNKNYLIPVGDNQIEGSGDVEHFTVPLEEVLERVVERNPSHANIFILDCPGTYSSNGQASSRSATEASGLCKIKRVNGAFIQFACDAGQTDRGNLFSEHLLRHIASENVHIADIFQRIADDVYQESNRKQRPVSIDGLQQQRKVYLNYVAPPPPPPKPVLTTERFLTNERLSSAEEEFYADCKEYFHLTQQPLISIADEIFDKQDQQKPIIMKFGIDINCQSLDLEPFLQTICKPLKLTLDDIQMNKIQSGSAIVDFDVFNRIDQDAKRVPLEVINCTLKEKEMQKYLARLNIFFIFLGPREALDGKQQYRAKVKMNPEFNRKYSRDHDFWRGALNDGKDRGNKPYYCPVGWQRWSFYVTDDFNKKFRGWCIGYHGTKFAYGLSILLSGLKTAEVVAHGRGIYLTPSVNYACHPRYAEIKTIGSKYRSRFFKSGKFVQLVLECRVHPSKIRKVAEETLGAENTVIDRNIGNEEIEWLVSNEGKEIVDFNDPMSPLVCTAVMVRVTDSHPGLLPESRWWYESGFPDDSGWRTLSLDRNSLKILQENSETCNILFD